MRVHLK